MSALQINPFAYETLKCSECGNETFIPGVIFKKVPGVMVGDASEEFVPIPIKVGICSKCGAISHADKKMIEEQEKRAGQTKKDNKSNLIL